MFVADWTQQEPCHSGTPRSSKSWMTILVLRHVFLGGYPILGKPPFFLLFLTFLTSKMVKIHEYVAIDHIRSHSSNPGVSPWVPGVEMIVRGKTTPAGCCIARGHGTGNSRTLPRGWGPPKKLETFGLKVPWTGAEKRSPKRWLLWGR